MNKLGTMFFKNSTSQDVFDFEPKEENCCKLRLHIDDTYGEGIWICLDPKDKADYDANKIDDESSPYRFACLRNMSLNLGDKSWGVILPYKLRGRDRPECNLTWIDGAKSGNFLYTSKDLEEMKKEKE